MKNSVLLSAAMIACAGAAWAGNLPTPLPLAGLGGPVGVAVGVAAYLAYRVSRRNDHR